MFYDPTARPVAPDLSRPSLEALAYILRNRHLWPSGFVFSYNSCSQCAMGLARRAWPESIETESPYDMAGALGVSIVSAQQIFMMRRSKPERDNFTPEAIASDLEALR